MSSFAGYCPYCRKPVMHKTFFGTLHICLTSEERSAVDRQNRAMIAQQRAVKNPLLELIKTASAGIGGES